MIHIQDFFDFINKKIKARGLNKIIILFTVLIPLDIYIIGHWIGAGVQFSLFRIQTTYMGDSVIYLTDDLQYVIAGIYKGNTALSVLIWVFGVLLLIAGILFFIFEKISEQLMKKRLGTVIIISAFLFSLSIIIQYSLYFHGPAGTAIPIGLPVLFIIGGWLYYEGSRTEDEVEVKNTDSQE